jgi:hypothetical protein
MVAVGFPKKQRKAPDDYQKVTMKLLSNACPELLWLCRPPGFRRTLDI